MSNSEIYEYAIIRVLPKVEREEFVNVGVILFSKRKEFLDMKVHLDETRLLAFSKELDLDMLNGYLLAWEKVCKGGDGGGTIGQLEMHLRFRWLTANRSTIIQSSKVHPGRSNNPVQKLEDLFAKFVLQEEN